MDTCCASVETQVSIDYILTSFIIPRFVIRECDLKQPRRRLEIPASSKLSPDLEIFPVGLLNITQK